MGKTVADIIRGGVSYDSSWGIYATGCEATAEARIGRSQFENGGLLDNKHFICDGVQLGDAIRRWTDGEDVDADDLDIDGLLQYEICE